MIAQECILQLTIIALCLTFVNCAVLLPSVSNQTTVSWEIGTRPENKQTTVLLNVHPIDLLSKPNIQEEKSCKKNEIWTNCTGCELKCDDDDHLECQNMYHGPGCECSALLGFRRAANGNCIHKEDCPARINKNSDFPIRECSATEEYKECGIACEETCDDFRQPIICTQKCVAGCFCRKGYIREKKGGCCVPPELCNLKKRSRTCGPNQEYRKCGTACPKTCDGIPENCTQRCVDGCFCKNGYVLDLDKCIPESDCQVSRECNENEVYRKCGSPCQEICGEQKEKDCDNCIEGCFCKLGYVMEEKAGACVKPENCLPPKYMKCSENETFTYCSSCEGTCQNQFVNCPDECGSPKCECLAKKNYVRNKYGTCIHIRDCINN